MENKRPLGVTLIGIAIIIYGLCISSLFFVFNNAQGLILRQHQPIMLVVLLIVGAYVVSAVFLLRLKRWAWFSTMGITLFLLLSEMFNKAKYCFYSLKIYTSPVVNASSFDWRVFLINVLIDCCWLTIMIIAIVYLARPKVRRLFK